MPVTPQQINYGTTSGSLAALSDIPSLGGMTDYSAISNYGANGMPGSMPDLSFAKSGSGLGFNLGTANLALQGLGTIGSLWAGFKSLGLAKQKFKFEKNVSETNLLNSIKSYNTRLSDRSRSRAATEGQSADTAAAYVRDNTLTRAPM